MSTRLILIRHGETDWSRERRYCSFTDVDLNERGKAQAIELSERLKGEDIHKVYSSDLKRALKFAEIVFKGMSIEGVQELREINFGLFEGLTHDQIMERHAGIYTKWLSDPFKAVIPKGDDLVDFKKRIEEVLTKIIALNKGRTVAVVTHAGPIKIIMSNVLKSKNIWEIKPDLGTFNVVDFDDRSFVYG